MGRKQLTVSGLIRTGHSTSMVAFHEARLTLLEGNFVVIFSKYGVSVYECV